LLARLLACSLAFFGVSEGDREGVSCGVSEPLCLRHRLATVAEAVRFSAALRLDADATAREAFCEFILDQLELSDVRDRQVGVLGAGLSFDQRKKLGVAVEVASNPAVPFLDEPTCVRAGA